MAGGNISDTSTIEIIRPSSAATTIATPYYHLYCEVKEGASPWSQMTVVILMLLAFVCFAIAIFNRQVSRQLSRLNRNFQLWMAVVPFRLGQRRDAVHRSSTPLPGHQRLSLSRCVSGSSSSHSNRSLSFSAIEHRSSDMSPNIGSLMDVQGMSTVDHRDETNGLHPSSQIIISNSNRSFGDVSPPPAPPPSPSTSLDEAVDCHPTEQTTIQPLDQDPDVIGSVRSLVWDNFLQETSVVVHNTSSYNVSLPSSSRLPLLHDTQYWV